MIDLVQNQAEIWHKPSHDSARSLTAGAESAFTFQSVAEARRALTSGHSTEHRVAAVWRMASSDDEFMAATLVAALFDTEEEVRRAAAQALSQSRDPEIPAASIENLFPQENNWHGQHSWDAAVAELKSPHAEMRIRALSIIGKLKSENAFQLITDCFDDESARVRAAAVTALHQLNPERAADLFTDALNLASSTRRTRIVEAIQTSALGRELIDDLTGKNRAGARAALALLLLMAQVNAVRPLIEAIEEHESAEIRRSLVRILNLTGKAGLAEAAAKRRLGISSIRTLTL